MLTLVPTPIGNLDDITLRSLEALRNADAVLCEDTRTSGRLLKHYEIQKPLYSYHMHNEHKVVDGMVAQLQAGKNFALITDAGTPGISDPGYLLLRACIAADIEVQCLPGATAFVPALVNSGLPSSSFVFEGFLPLKKGRKTKWEQIAAESRTVILYESPHRLIKSLAEGMQYCGAERQASVSREISKLFEETRRGTFTQLHTHYTAHPPKGEIVIVIATDKYTQLQNEPEAS